MPAMLALPHSKNAIKIGSVPRAEDSEIAWAAPEKAVAEVASAVDEGEAVAEP